MEKFGAGELLLTSMDRDGTKSGFDLELTRAISDAVDIPIIASGGVATRDAGDPSHVLLNGAKKFPKTLALRATLAVPPPLPPDTSG